MTQLPIGDIGPCEVTWDYGDTDLIITPYLGRVSLRAADTVTDIHEEGGGLAPVDAFFGGMVMEFEVPMARSTLNKLAETIGYASMGTLAGSVLTLHNIAGFDMYALSKTIVIKPLCNNVPDPDPHHWTVIHRCHPYRDIDLGYDRGGQRIHLVKFKIFPNRDTGYEGDYFQEGVLSWRDDFEDQFCDAVIGSEWTEEKTDADKTIVPNSTPPCWVTIAVAGAPPNINGRWAWDDILSPRLRQVLTATPPLRITTKIRSFTVNDGSFAGLFIGRTVELPHQCNPPRDCYFWGRYRDDTRMDGIAVLDNCLGIYASLSGAPWVPGADWWFRIIIDTSEDITFWHSADGETWIQAEDTGVPYVLSAYYTANLNIGIFAGNHFRGTQWNAIAAPFEFFKIEAFT